MDGNVRTADPVKIERIIDAAAQLFAERHYHEVRMDDIAAKAGVAKGTIYLHFKDKDDLYQALALDSLKKLSKRIRDGLVGVDDPATKLLSVNREVIQYFEHRAFTLDLIIRERLQEQEHGANKAFFEVRDEFMRILHSILDEFPEAGHRSEADISLAVLALSGISREVLQRLPRPWPANLPERLTRLFLEGFLRPGTSETARSS
ncbi:MAG TPA: TetR/AcrR family transcriptional regulator [Isosphaeraceae bacterium]|nr:TetR/AcrR family transcriptional regulator [Isosphaeraceae bacterium]